MKKLFISKHIRYSPIALLAVSCMLSCSNQEKEFTNSFYKMEYTTEDIIIDFNTMVSLEESNQKAIELSNISLKLSEDLKTQQLLLKIKRDNLKINSDFDKLTKDNLIIIPKPIYHFYAKDSINNQQPDLYILKKLENEIKNQIISLDSIEKNTPDFDFKLFAKQSRRTLENNNEKLKTLLSN